MIANYRIQAELTSVESTEDGKAIVLGTVDGCVSVLAIVDKQKKDMCQYLATMPSRDEEVWKIHVISIKVTQALIKYITCHLLDIIFGIFKLKLLSKSYYCVQSQLHPLHPNLINIA